MAALLVGRYKCRMLSGICESYTYSETQCQCGIGLELNVKAALFIVKHKCSTIKHVWMPPYSPKKATGNPKTSKY